LGRWIDSPGILALVGGGEWHRGLHVRRRVPGGVGSDEVLVLPTAAAYEHPERLVVRAGEWFEPLGGQVEGLMVLSRADAEDAGAAAVMRRARLIYLAGGSPMHLRSVLKHSLVWEALVAAWRDGAVVVGSSGAAMALTDPMVDARGGGLTIGLGLVSGVAVVPHFGDVHEDAHGEKLHRSVHLAPPAPRWPASRADGPHPRPRRGMALGREGSGGRVPRRGPGRGRSRAWAPLPA
jgi:cyanophycinase